MFFLILFYLFLDSGLTSRVLMEGSLSEKVRCEESLWSLIPSQYISICLEKVQAKWWTRVLETDPEIDKQKIDTTQQVNVFSSFFLNSFLHFFVLLKKN